MHEEEKIDDKALQMASIEEMFLGVQESYSQAQQRAIEENKSFAKTEFFRMDKFGIYRLRIMPIAPNTDGSATRNGYEFPVRQMLMELVKPGATGKGSSLYVTVPRTTDAGYSVDLIDTYRKLAVAMAKDNGDDKLADKIAGGSFGGGLKFNYGHALYVLDLTERAKGLQLLTLSHSQFKELDERKFKLWQKKLAKNPDYPCPISSVHDAYPVEIEKRKNGNKTEYYIGIDNESDCEVLAKEELMTLMNAPRIPDIIYRYSRYQFEATVEFLRQCDSKYELSIMENEQMKEAVETLRSELPKEDTSSFSFDKRTKDSKDNAENTTITLDQLFDRHDQLCEQSLGDKTEEGQELRTMIRSFIEQEKLPIRVTRSTTNGELLDQIEAHLQGSQSDGHDNEPEPDSQDAPVSTARRR